MCRSGQALARTTTVRCPALIAICLTACVTAPNEPATPEPTSRAVHLDMPVWSRAPLDLLFVIDDSPAMAPFQASLATSFATFASMLENSPGGVPDLHAGVITADPSDGGVIRGAPQVTGGFLSTVPRLDGSREQNFSGTLHDALVTAAGVGTRGAEIMQPLAMIQRALDGNPANASFLRDNAYLAVVVISAREDRSAGLVVAYASFLRRLKTDPARVIVSAAFNPEPGSQACTAEAAPRLAELLVQFPYRASSAPLCSPDLAALSSGLEEYTDQVPLGVACLTTALADADAVHDGTQYQCAVELTSATQRIPVRACSGELHAPCWRIERDPAICPDAEHEKFTLVRAGLAFPAPTSLKGDCLAE